MDFRAKQNGDRCPLCEMQLVMHAITGTLNTPCTYVSTINIALLSQMDMPVKLVVKPRWFDGYPESLRFITIVGVDMSNNDGKSPLAITEGVGDFTDITLEDYILEAYSKYSPRTLGQR